MGMLTNILSTAAGFIPGVGPMISPMIQKLGESKMMQGLGSSIGSGISGAIGGLPSALITQKMDRANSARAFESSMGAYKSRYQNTVQDMRKAGINPIMAASGGFNVGTSPTRPPIPGVNLATGATSARQFKETEQLDTKRKQILQDIRESKQRIGKIDAETEVAYQKVFEIIQNTEKLFYVTQDTRAAEQVKHRAKAKINAEIKIIEAQLIRIKQKGKVHSGTIGLILNYINEIREVLGLKFGGIKLSR